MLIIKKDHIDIVIILKDNQLFELVCLKLEEGINFKSIE